jgi:ZIP family zinc transporter
VDPTLLVLLASAISAGTAALGPLPLVGRESLPVVAIGWANALASGLMLGAAYLLILAGMEYVAIWGALGAALGIGYVWLTHRAAGTGDMNLNHLGETDEVYGYKLLLVNTLHSAPEGVAIGVAMAGSVPFGLFMALALAVHNVPEATVLSAILRGRGVGFAAASALGVMTNVTQVLLAVVAYAVVSAAPVVMPWAIGFGVGSLIYLVLSELLPESYREAGRTTIALVTFVAMAIVVLMGGLAR